MKKLITIFGSVAMITIPLFACQAAPIEDNSFLLEEAYNQEEGVVQFIQTLQSSKTSSEKTLNYSFTNEIPVTGQNHQFSYVIPYLKSKTEGKSNSGLGDILLNYRYQLINTDTIAMAPRFSLILPTGDRAKGFGSDTYGVQTNFALSVLLNKHFVSHWNMGYTLIPKAKGQVGNGTATTFGTNFGASLIYLMRDNFNFLVEFVHNSTEVSNGDNTVTREESYFVNPGFRFAIDYPSTQVVPGVSFPIGIGPSKKDDFSILAYLSIEPKLW